MNMKPLIQTVLFGGAIALSSTVVAQDVTSTRTQERAQIRDQTQTMSPAERDAYFGSLRNRAQNMSQEERRSMNAAPEVSGSGVTPGRYQSQPQYQHRNRNEYHYGDGYESRQGAGQSGGGFSGGGRSAGAGGGGGGRR